MSDFGPNSTTGQQNWGRNGDPDTSIDIPHKLDWVLQGFEWDGFAMTALPKEATPIQQVASTEESIHSVVEKVSSDEQPHLVNQTGSFVSGQDLSASTFSSLNPNSLESLFPDNDCPNFRAGRIPCACTEADASLAAKLHKHRPDLFQRLLAPTCQIMGCNANLLSLKEYHQRHRVCELHARAVSVFHYGENQRYCQQCGRFHPIGDFDDGKRSCRRKLERHNDRRRRKKMEKEQNDDSGDEDVDIIKEAKLKKEVTKSTKSGKPKKKKSSVRDSSGLELVESEEQHLKRSKQANISSDNSFSSQSEDTDSGGRGGDESAKGSHLTNLNSPTPASSNATKIAMARDSSLSTNSQKQFVPIPQHPQQHQQPWLLAHQSYHLMNGVAMAPVFPSLYNPSVAAAMATTSGISPLTQPQFPMLIQQQPFTPSLQTSFKPYSASEPSTKANIDTPEQIDIEGSEKTLSVLKDSEKSLVRSKSMVENDRDQVIPSSDKSLLSMLLEDSDDDADKMKSKNYPTDKNDINIPDTSIKSSQAKQPKQDSNMEVAMVDYPTAAPYVSPSPTKRISFKLYDWNPAEFPRDLRNQVNHPLRLPLS